MNSLLCKISVAALAVALWHGVGVAQSVVDFEDVGSALATDTAFVGADLSGGYTSGGVDFQTNFNTTFGSWNGAAYSNRTSWNVGGASGFEEFQFGNDTTVTSPTGDSGLGFDGSDTWGVLFGFAPNEARFEIGDGRRFEGLYINNTRTTAFTLENGNGPARAFTDGDRFEVIFNSLAIEVVDGVEQITVLGSSDPIPLAVGTSIVNDWTWVDLRGTAVEDASIVGVEFSSTDVGTFGINTPTYLAIDNLTFTAVAVPEPTSWTIVGLIGLAGCLVRKRNK